MKVKIKWYQKIITSFFFPVAIMYMVFKYLHKTL